MIRVTLLNDREIVINADLIELVEETPDTIITLSTDKKIIVKESVDEIISRVIAYKRRIYNSGILGTEWEEYTN
jgi:flagellar protein FlbD